MWINNFTVRPPRASRPLLRRGRGVSWAPGAARRAQGIVVSLILSYLISNKYIYIYTLPPYIYVYIYGGQLPRAGLPVTRVHLTTSISLLKNRLLVALLQTLSDLDPRSPISFRTSLVMLPYPPPFINEAGRQVSLTTLVTRALGLSRNLALLHNYE